MKRADEGLAFLLRYENVAWYESGKVKILDRRIYPRKVKYVICNNHKEVANAIKNMVTQSGGPYLAAAMGMALAAHEVKDKIEEEQIKHLKKAAYTLSHARPTTAKKMKVVVNKAFSVAKKSIKTGQKTDKVIFKHALEEINMKYKKINKIANNLVDYFPDKGTIMTQCFAESIVGFMLKEAEERNKKIKIICPETRPYFQGARLTASVACDQGFDVTVITDNMPGYIMKKENVDLFTSAADAITIDGHVINKIGTFQIAMAAHYYGIPYFVSGSPDINYPNLDSVEIENRDGDFVLQAMGVKTTMKGVKGYYPSFDITPPKFVSGIVTEKGIYSPYNLKKYFL